MASTPDSSSAATFTSDQLDDGLNQLLPPGHLHVLGLLMRDTGQSLPELIDWYENIHAPNARFSWPHMRRYARNYITHVEEGPTPPYRVLTEFDWKSEEDKVKARAAFKSPAALQAMASEFEGTPPAWLADIYSILVPVTPLQASGAPLPDDRTEPVQRRALLLRRRETASQQQFEQSLRRLADEIAALAPDAGVTIGICHGPSTAREEPDAVLFVHDAADIALPRPHPAVSEVINVFAVEMRKSPIRPSGGPIQHQ